MKTLMTKIDLVKIDQTNLDATAQTAAELLESGGIIVAPTETRYGLLCRADQKAVLDRLYQLKNRPLSMPCSVFIKSREHLAGWGVINSRTEKIADAFWPGPVTLVLEAKADFPAPVISDGKIGIRFSTDPFIVALMEQVSFPVSATSANLSGTGDATTIDALAEVFDDKVDMYCDDGVRNGATSTVIDMTFEPPKLLRAGAVEFDKILKVIE